MNPHMNYMNKKASVSIETAISFSIVIVFITALISITSFLRTDILMQRAVNQTCEDFAHFTPFSITAADSISTITNAIPGDFDFSNIDELGSLLIGADILTQGELRSSIVDLALGNQFADDIASEYIEYGGDLSFKPESINVDFSFRENYIEVFVGYEVKTIIGGIQRQVLGVIPFYGEYDLFLNAQSIENQDSGSIWQEDNFTRGIYFAQRYGANLPHTFPTINYYDDGTIMSITSIDLNRPTYSSPVNVSTRMIQQIDRISDFNGASTRINGEVFEVDGNSIQNRRVLFVLPEDYPENLNNTVNGIISYGISRGVNVEIVTDGCSRI